MEKLIKCKCGEFPRLSIKNNPYEPSGCFVGQAVCECGVKTPEYGLFNKDYDFIIRAWNEKRLNESKPRKCPFCGGEAELLVTSHEIPIFDTNSFARIDTEYRDLHYFSCSVCHCTTDGYSNEIDALDSWNAKGGEKTMKLNEYEDTIKTDKKSNMEYWDALDATTEEYVKALCHCSVPSKSFDDDTVVYLAKNILEHAVKVLEEEGCEFPYVDENY